MTIVDEEYVEARRVLLDALTALGEHRQAIIVAGAQAIYLRAGERVLPVSDYTTDADLTLDPSLLADEPELEALLKSAGFEHVARDEALEPGAWQAAGSIRGEPVSIPLDLIVPAAVSEGGRRSVELGPHGTRAARRSQGLEAALVDNEPMLIEALDPADDRSLSAKVAGLPALLIAKSYKITDRVADGRESRTSIKDASDVIRIMQAIPASRMAAELKALVSHPTVGSSAELGIAHFMHLFGRRNGDGVRMARRALEGVLDEQRVRALCLAYSERLAGEIGAEI